MEKVLAHSDTLTEQLENIEEDHFTALFIGCHADDLEIGAGGSIASMVEGGWTVWGVS